MTIGRYQHEVSLSPHTDVDGEVPSLLFQEDLEEWLPVLEDILKKNPSIMHYMVEPNVTACMRGGDKKFIDVWGHHHVLIKELVGCQFCLEWLHA